MVLTDDGILMFAHQFKTHPAIIMGRFPDVRKMIELVKGGQRRHLPH